MKHFPQTCRIECNNVNLIYHINDIWTVNSVTQLGNFPTCETLVIWPLTNALYSDVSPCAEGMLFISVHNATWHLQKCHDNWPKHAQTFQMCQFWCDIDVTTESWDIYFFWHNDGIVYHTFLHQSSDVQSRPQRSHVVAIFHSCQDGATPNSTCLISLDQSSTESWASGVASAWQEMKSCSKTDTSLGWLDPWFCSSVYFWYVTYQELKSNSL